MLCRDVPRCYRFPVRRTEFRIAVIMIAGQIPCPAAAFRHFFDRFAMHTGMLYAAIAYAIWGVFPLYFKSLQEIPPLEILLHRMAWSMVFVLVVLTVRKQWAWLRDALQQPKVLGGFALSALLLSTN